jgi:hypothetical protein
LMVLPRFLFMALCWVQHAWAAVCQTVGARSAVGRAFIVFASKMLQDFAGQSGGAFLLTGCELATGRVVYVQEGAGGAVDAGAVWVGGACAVKCRGSLCVAVNGVG